MKKLLLVVLSVLLIISCTACAQKSVEPQISPEDPNLAGDPAEESAITTNYTVPGLEQVNIYHLGIMTALELSEVQTADLANRLHALLEDAAATDSMDTAPADSANPIRVMASQTALELIYTEEIELPIKSEGTPLSARRILYSIPAIDGNGDLLYLGGEIYDELPVGKLFDQSLQDLIYDSAADQVERVSFSAGGQQVGINGQEYAYHEGESSTEIPGALLNRMLYRGIAFYLNAYTGNVDGLKMMSTGALTDAIAAVKDGQSTDNALGEETIYRLNQYILADYFLPQTINAPVEQGEGYMLLLELNEFASIQIEFMLDDDMPLVSALHLLVADPVAEEQ